MIKIAIVGGGPAGMMAAITAANDDTQVTILEKNEKLGKKLFITGKGRCNICNNCSYDEFFTYVKRGAKFMMSSFSRFDNRDLMSFFQNQGLSLKVERGGRVFPTSDKASDVITVLVGKIRASKINVKLNYNIVSIEKVFCKDGDDTFLINNDLIYDKVIICTGGKSYKSTGSDGSGYPLANKLGHSISEIMPALSALVTKNLDLSELQGVALKNIELKMLFKKRIVYSDIGEMLFTHFGISGPLVLSMSSCIDNKKIKEYKVLLDLKPALSEEKLYNRIQRDFQDEPKRIMRNVLRRLLPAGLIDVILQRCNIDPNVPCNQLNSVQRRQLAKTLKQFVIQIDDFHDIDQAIVTRGGVKLKDISPKTMESKICKNLYFAGEVMDIDALTGGYNLQVAFTTGYCAGLNATLNDNYLYQ